MPHVIWTADEGLHDATEQELKDELVRVMQRLHGLPRSLKARAERQRLERKARRLANFLNNEDYADEPPEPRRELTPVESLILSDTPEQRYHRDGGYLV